MKKERQIDYIMKKLGFSMLKGGEKPKMYNMMYKAVENDISFKSVTNGCFSIKYIVSLYMTEDDWNFRFDKIGFILKIRNDFHSYCRFISVDYVLQGVVVSKFEIKVLDKRS